MPTPVRSAGELSAHLFQLPDTVVEVEHINAVGEETIYYVVGMRKYRTEDDVTDVVIMDLDEDEDGALNGHFLAQFLAANSTFPVEGQVEDGVRVVVCAPSNVHGVTVIPVTD